MRIRDQMQEILQEAVKGVADVFYFYPPADTKYPCVSVYNMGDAQYATTTEGEYLTEYIWVVDVWGNDVSQVDSIGDMIDTAVKKIGFHRQFAQDVYDSNCIHKTMRFRGVLNPENHVSN